MLMLKLQLIKQNMKNYKQNYQKNKEKSKQNSMQKKNLLKMNKKESLLKYQLLIKPSLVKLKQFKELKLKSHLNHL